MPPKKKGAAAKAKAKAAAALTPRATRTSVPDTVTTSRGKEYETTAALARPRRESTLLQSPVVVKKAAAKKPVVKKTATATPTKKRGRPAKAAVDDEPPAKRGPGRPAKKVAEEVDDEEEDEDEDEAAVGEPIPAPKARGRPPNKITKPAPKKPAAAKAAAKAAPKAPAKRGRPSKADEDAGESAVEEAPPQKRGRGRPPKKMEDAVPKQESGPPKKRGSSPRGGETTKIDGDDGAAAEQLEDELIDTAEEAASKPAPRGRGRPKGTGKGKGAKAKAPTHDEEEQEAGDDDEFEATSGKQYWLMKAEQEDREEILENGETFNTKFTVNDLKSKGGPEPWDGVRNAVAAKNMRAMKQGDLAFFYASGGKSGRKPGIVGIMEIVKEHEPDQTAWDKGAYGYVKDAKARDRWCVVHVEYRNKLIEPVLLSDLQKHSGDGGELSKMQVLKQSRLSVTKVSEAEWNFIVEQLIEGFEEDALPGAEASLTNGTTNAEEESTLITTEQADGEVIINEASDKELDLDLPPGTVPAGPVLPTTESEVPSTDTIFPAGTSQTSRPASRAGSHAPSVKAKAKAASRQSSRASSVAGSLALPATEGRGRSRTPKVRAGSAAPTNGINGDGLAGMQTIGEDDE